MAREWKKTWKKDSMGRRKKEMYAPITQDINHLVTSDEMYMSESYGYNFSVNSEAMDQFDYVEDVEPIDSPGHR